MKTTEVKTNTETGKTTASLTQHSPEQEFFSPVHENRAPFFGFASIQPKLEIGRPDDQYEREADRMADAVVNTPEPQVQRQTCEEEEEKLQMQAMDDKEKEEGLQMKLLEAAAPLLQRKCAGCEEKEKLQKKSDKSATNAASGYAGNAISSQLKSSAGTGSRLPGAAQSEMGQKMGADFSGVSVHTDSKSVQMNRQLGAKAFTYGRDVYFNSGQYRPETSAGKHLLAHELTHVVQQGGGVQRSIQRHVLENDPLTAPPMTCLVATTSPAGTGLDITFGSNSSTLTPLDLAAVDNFVNNWHVSGASDPVRIDGFSSIDGVPALNWPLSCDRAEILANELMTPTSGIPGIPSSFIEIFANGETDQFSAALGPNRRATATVPIPPPTATGAVFSESSAQVFHGYDNSVITNFQVVPVGETRIANVVVTPAGALPTFISSDPSIVTVRSTATGIEVTGVADGAARIEARQGSTVLGTLRIEVKSQRDITVDYHFMSDTARAPSFFGLIPGAPQHSTSRVPVSATGFTATLNRIWQRQANVQFTTGTVDSKTVPTNLGAQVVGATNAASEWRAINAFSTGGDWNVFLVWEFELVASAGTDAANAGTAGAETMLEDNECADALTIAHEAGHFLSGASLPHTASGIMAGCGGASRRRVRKNEADAVNP